MCWGSYFWKLTSSVCTEWSREVGDEGLIVPAVLWIPPTHPGATDSSSSPCRRNQVFLAVLSFLKPPLMRSELLTLLHSPEKRKCWYRRCQCLWGSFSCLSKTFGQPLGMGVEKQHLLQICSWRDNLRISKQCQSPVIPQPFHACSLARWRCCYVAKRN